MVGVFGSAAASVPASAEIVRDEIYVEAPVEKVWSAVRDVYNVHERLVPGMVVSVERDDDVRIVTFANGFVVKERIVAIDDEARRLVYSAFGGKTTHHAASMEVVPEGSGSQITWITYFLPADHKTFIAGNISQGLKVMKSTLEGRSEG